MAVPATRISISFVLATALCAGSLVHAQTNERVSLGNAGEEGSAGSSEASISADGRFVVFTSSALEFAPRSQQQVPFNQIFLRDRSSGTTELISVGSGGGEASGVCGMPSVSADGNFVAFASNGDNLVPGLPANGLFTTNVYVRDRRARTTQLVSRGRLGDPGDRDSAFPAISADGRFVAFISNASNLVEDGRTAADHVYVRDLLTGTTELVNVSSSGERDGFGPPRGAGRPAISGDGRFVAFASDGIDTVLNNASWTDVFVRDRATGRTELVSVGRSDGAVGARQPAISGDGRFVAFSSDARSFSGDVMPFSDIFVRDRQTGITERITSGPAGEELNDNSFSPAISADGRFVTYESLATNLLPIVGLRNVFVFDRQTRTTQLASTGRTGEPAQGSSSAPSISARGDLVAFAATAPDLIQGDLNGVEDAFVRVRRSANEPIVSFTANGERVSDGMPAFPAPLASPSFRSGQPLQLDAVALDVDGLGFPVFDFLGVTTPLSFIWNFGGGQGSNPLAVFAQRPVVTFQLPPGQESGSFTVTVIAFDQTGLSSTATGSIAINRTGPPVLNLIVEGSILPATPGLATVVNVLKPDGVVRLGSLAFDESGLGFPIFAGFGFPGPISYLWTFGGGVPANVLEAFSPNPTVTFPVGAGQPTQFQVSLTVLDATGQSSTRSANIHLGGTTP